MPYSNVPAADTRRMDSCVRKVVATGKDKQTAIAICHSSIVKRKERRAARLATFKAPNYGARAGETIAGALGRGAGGKFVRADGSAASGREVINALTARAKKPKAGAKPKRTDAEQAATGEAAGIDSADFAALQSLSKAGAVSDGDASRLVNLGLAERGKDGALRMAGSARSLLRAAQSGDVQGAKDALSKGRDKVAAGREREAKRGEREAVSAGKRAVADAKRGEREARANQARQDRQAKRRDDELQKATDRIKEIQAVATGDKNVTEAERVKRLNQLDALDKRINAAGGSPALSKAIDTLRKKLSSDAEAEADEGGAGSGEAFIPLARKETGDRFAVFKQADGRWRWMTHSSNAYQDRDTETLSTKSLDADTARMQDEGAYGPFRFWHLGDVKYGIPLDWRTSSAGVGLDIGETDFSAMQDRMLVESGTFKEGAPVEAIAADPDKWQVSIGFTHPPNEPDADGVYHNIRIFERSLLPRGRAANPFTAIAVSKEVSDMASLKEKWGEFVALFNGDEAKAKEYATQTEAKQKQIESSGVAFKEGDAAAAAADDAPSTTTEAKADEAATEVEAEGEGGEVAFVGDMTTDEFKAVFAEVLAPLLQGVAEAASKEIAAVGESAAATAKQLADLQQVRTKEASDAAAAQARIAALDERIKELEGDAPTGKTKGYRASQDDGTVTTKQVAAPQMPDDLAKMVALAFGSGAGNGNGAGASNQ